MPLAPGTSLGPYRLIGLVGAGGMGEVYRARDERLGRDVAIKVLPADVAGDPARLARFEREARATAALEHSNILPVYDVGQHEGQPYLVTQLLEGETLSRAIAVGPLPVSKVVTLGTQIARGLAAAHERGIVHRDLKPSNIFLTSDGGVKILDFGLARLSPGDRPSGQLADHSTATDWTLAGAVVGTVGYMSPEQVRGLPADSRSDIFSFGCVLYEMLAGRRAFLKDSAVETLGAVLHEDPPRLAANGRSVPPALVAVVQRCLEKRLEDRFQSAYDVALAIEAISPSISGAPARTLYPQWPWRRWIAGAAVAAAVMLVAIGLGRVVRRGALPEFEPRQVTSRPELESEPAISPLGTDIAYVAQDGALSDIWVVDVRGGQPLRLTTDGAYNGNPTWFPDGSALAYTSMRGGSWSVWKVPRLGGSPLLLVPDAEDQSISPDGTTLAFARLNAGGYSRIEVAPISAPLQSRVLTTDDDGVWNHQQPVWSPDGRTICYHDQTDLWLVPVQGGRARRLTEDDPIDYDPVWSPSGRWVYFASTRQQTQAIWRVDVGSGEVTRVTMGTGQERGPTVTRSGDRLAYSTLAERTSFELVDTSAQERTRLERGRLIFEASIAPDRSWLVFGSNTAGSFDLWRLPLQDNRPAGDPVRLTELPGGCFSPAISPDGRWVAFQNTTDGQRDLWVMPAEGGMPVNVTRHPAAEILPAWSPDGSRLAFVSDRSGVDQVWVATVRDGGPVGEPRHIAGVDGVVTSPSWSPDGSRIALVEITGAESEVWTVAVDGSQPPVRLTQGSKAWSVQWSRSSGDLFVLGMWDSSRLAIRTVASGGGAPRELPAAVPSDGAANLLGFDLSLDGRLLVLNEKRLDGDVWVLEAKKGKF